MDRLRYTASGRLGIWDSLITDKDAFLASLARIIVPHSHAVLEADTVEFVPTDDSSLACVTAICDKIISRGNPTLVDFNFEHALLNGSCRGYLRFEELKEGATFGFQLLGLECPGIPAQLLVAAQELLTLPFRNIVESTYAHRPLEPELRNLASEEEDLFLEQFQTSFGNLFASRLHRQVLIRDLVDHADDELVHSRVDFAFQIGSVRWIFEVDGSQHREPGQHALDEKRDDLLNQHGWVVYRIPTEAVRKGLGNAFERLKSHLPPDCSHILNEPGHNSIEAVISKSKIHAAAFNSILKPIAVQRCLRGLLLLYSHGILDVFRKQRLLIVEEDVPVTVEAFRILREIWQGIHVLAPETAPPPTWELDIIGADPLDSKQPQGARNVRSPEGSYDMVLSHSFFLDAGDHGDIERVHFPQCPANYVRMRHAIGCRTERSLQRCEPLRYDLADIERSITSQNSDESRSMSADKREALLFFLKHVFRKRDFWDGQLRVVTRLLQGKPSIVLLPTGGGKSLTYQLSGLLLPGMTIIIDPLVSLMTDQVQNLEAGGIDLVNYVSSQLDPAAKDAVLRDMEEGRSAFIYISPERLQIQEFRNQLLTVVARFPVSLAVIDEAHCISEWGHDFRPSYLHMPHNLQRYCSNGNGWKPTLVGLTGTASFSVLTDIQMEMQIRDEDAIILPRSFDRQELRFEVRNVPMAAKPSALKTLKMQIPGILRENPQHFYDVRGDRTNSGIVFCPHVNGSLGVSSVAGQLGHGNFFAGQQPKAFGGDWLEWNDRKYKIQQAFKRNRVQELIATKSFGMGIDKPNIRYTIHYVIPQSVEAFYQEAGRAGRNGIFRSALCSILYSDDNWDVALEILNEQDHQRAVSRLAAINWDDRGDLLVQLWLLFNSYRGRFQEKKLTLDFWKKKLAPVIAGMPSGATNTQELEFRDDKSREMDERAIFRLMLLGVVQDYTINWQFRRFAIRVQRISSDQVRNCLRRYLLQYKFEDFADETVKKIPEGPVEKTLEAAIDVLIDFIYDEIVTKRKQALRTMGELCRNFTSDEDFREAILAYLQESEFSDELRDWVNRSFDDIRLENIHSLLSRVTTLEEVKRLVGTTRRMLDEDPKNLALRYLSMCARAQSAVESNSSVLQEATALIIQINSQQEDIHDPDALILAMLDDVASRRPSILEEIGDITLRRAGSVSIARQLLQSRHADTHVIYSHSVKLVAADVLMKAMNTGFYAPLIEEDMNA